MPATAAKTTAKTTARTTAKTTKAPAAEAPAAKAPAAEAPAKTARTGKTAALKSAAGKSADLSQEVFTSVEAGQRTAIAAVRTFVDTVDNALPAGVHPSRRETVIDAALDMADKLVTTQYHFLRTVVRSADRSLKLSGTKANNKEK